MAVTYRILTIADLDLFFTFFSQMIAHEFPEYSVKLQKEMLSNPTMWTRENYQQRFYDTNKYFLGAFDQNKLVGCIEATKPFGGISYCSWVLVEESHQKQGIGEHLLKEWQTWAKDQGSHGIYLYTIKRNEQYYKKMGFTCIGIFEKAWFGIDNYIFTKSLPTPERGTSGANYSPQPK